MTSSAEDNKSLLAPLRSHGLGFYVTVACLLAIVGWGLYAFYLEYVYGLGVTGDRVPVVWGLNVVNFVYFIAISMAGTIISGILRLSKAEWRRPITRIAEAITIAALPVGALFPLLDLGRPERVLNLFVLPRLQSPIAWDGIAIGTYLVASLIYFYLPLIPDLAVLRDSLNSASRLRRWLYTKLSLGWSGLAEQDRKLKGAIKIMAILVVPIAVSVHSVLSWVFAVTLRVEWHSTIFPIFFVMGAVYSGVATILIVVYAFRRFYHLEPYIQPKHFLYLAYIFLAADLAMIYLTVSEYMTPGWGSETLDVLYLNSLTTGTYAPYFWFMIIAGFLFPAFVISIPRTRTIPLFVIAAVFANLGMWVERFLIVIPSLAVPELSSPAGISYLAGTYAPSWEELSLTAAGLAGFALLLVIISRLVPIVSLWEFNEVEGTVSTPALRGSVPALYSDAAPQEPESHEPESPDRRNFLKTGLVTVVGAVGGFAALRLLPLEATKAQVSTFKQAQVTIATLGQTVTLDEASSKASFSFTVPSYLPRSTAFSQAILTSDGEMVGLFYANETMESISTYMEPVEIAIFQRKEDVINSPPAYLPKGFERLTVNGSSGFARAPLKANGGTSEPGQLQWWSGGKSCSILANMAVSDLVKIANSMEASENA